MLKIFISVLFFAATCVNAQNFHIVPNKVIKEKIIIENLNVDYHYSFEGFKYYLGVNLDDKTKEFGIYLLVFDNNGIKKFHSKSFLDSNTHSLTFFKSRLKPELTIILGHNSNEYSWGNEVYLLENGIIKNIGLLDVATAEPEYDLETDISKKTSIIINEDEIKFTFLVDSLTLNPGGRNHEVLSSKDIYYFYKKKQSTLELFKE